MLLETLLNVTTVYRIQKKRIERWFNDSGVTPSRSYFNALKRIEWFNTELAYLEATNYVNFYVEADMFGSGVSFIRASAVNVNKRFLLELEANCNTSELREALKHIGTIIRAYNNAHTLLGSAFEVTGGGMTLHCANLRELRCTARRVSVVVQEMIKKGSYGGN